jgi:hypothetical protein
MLKRAKEWLCEPVDISVAIPWAMCCFSVVVIVASVVGACYWAYLKLFA